MSRPGLIGMLCVSLWSHSVPAQETAKDPELVYDAQLSDYEYDFEVSFFSIQSQRQTLKMAYSFLEGQPDKPVVTLLHGKNFNAHYWTSTARYLNKQGYGVLIPDQIGFGKSSKPAHYQYSFQFWHSIPGPC